MEIIGVMAAMENHLLSRVEYFEGDIIRFQRSKVGDVNSSNVDLI